MASSRVTIHMAASLDGFIARRDGRVFATDSVEYDIAVAPGSPMKGFFYSPFKGNDSKDISLHFKRGEGFDQFGREQASGPEPRGGAGVWELPGLGTSKVAIGGRYQP